MQKKLVLYEKTKLIFVQIINNTEDEKNVIYVNDIFCLEKQSWRPVRILYCFWHKTY